MTDESLNEAVARLSRARLAALPTPLEQYPRLAAEIGASKLLVKRDDLTGLGFGGNKIRGLEFLLGQAQADGCDTFVAGGGVAQSNHARQCAAAARRLGMDCHLVLRRGLRANERTGNLLLTEQFEPTIHWVDEDPGLSDREGLAPVMDRVADELEAGGARPWVLHSSFHPLAATGYVVAATELRAQLDELGIGSATIVCTSMGATRIGLELAATFLELPWRVVAAGWRPLDDGLPSRLAGLAARTAETLGIAWSPGPERFPTLDTGGPDYGIPSDAGIEALKLAAASESLLLDPVYTAKGFGGLREALASERISRQTPVVFVHTGGLPALFAYGPSLRGEPA